MEDDCLTNTKFVMDESKKKELLLNLFSSFENGIRTPKADRPRRYLESKGLDFKKLGLGFNSGQFHHRESMEFKQSYEAIGILRKNLKVGVNKEGRVPYTCFGAYGVIYPLKNEWGEIVNLYADRFKLDTPRKKYLYKEGGVYPEYPSPRIKTLFLCFDIEETASLIQSKVLHNDQATIALKDGFLTKELLQLIHDRGSIKELVLLTPNSAQSPLEVLRDEFPERNVRCVELPMSVNAHLQNSELDQLASITDISALKRTDEPTSELTQSTLPKEETETALRQIHDQKIAFQGEVAEIEVLGRLPMDLSGLRVSLRLIHKGSGKVHRLKLDLFEIGEIEGKVSALTMDYPKEKLLGDLFRLTSLLETHREAFLEEEFNGEEQLFFRELTPGARKEAMAFLQQKDLLKDLNLKIEQSGIVGEQQSRLTTFIIASSYKMPYPLHGLIQAGSGNGKSHLINSIAALMPSEDVVSLTRITSRSLYNYQRDQLMYKLILIQDEEGLDEESLYAFRELQSAGFLSSSTSQRNGFGKQQSKVVKVQSHFASLMATTKTEVYTDNESRSIVIGIDESDQQTRRIIEYSNRLRAGLIDQREREKTTLLLRNAIRLLQRKEVVNPFAHRIELPLEAKSLRRLNNQFQDFVAQITLLHQFQREEDPQGRIITTLEDVSHAIELFFSCIMVKVDELDASSRQLYDRLKEYVLTSPKGKKHTFSRRELREALRMKKTKTAEFIGLLLELEYIHIESGSVNRGYNYQITEWDEGLSKLQERIKADLSDQLHRIKQSDHS